MLDAEFGIARGCLLRDCQMIDPRERRQFAGQKREKAADAVLAGLSFDDDAIGRIENPSANAALLRDAINERPEAYPLHHPPEFDALPDDRRRAHPAAYTSGRSASFARMASRRSAARSTSRLVIA